MSTFVCNALHILTLELARLLAKSEKTGLEEKEIKALDLLIKNQQLLAGWNPTRKENLLAEEELLRLLDLK